MSVPLVRKQALEAVGNVTAPAQKHATDDAVYTTRFEELVNLDFGQCFGLFGGSMDLHN